MKHADIKAMMAEIAPVIREFTEAAVQPVMARLDALERQLADLPTPRNGKDGEPGPKGEKGDTGPGIDSIDVNLIDDGATAVFTFTSGDTERSFEVPLPAGPRGADGEPGEPGAKGDPGKDGRDGRDGLDVKDLFRADGGRLLAVMSDGTTKDLGEFVGKNGADGPPGRDGADGFGFDDVDLVVADDGAALVFARGDEKKAFALPIIVDCGVYKQGRAYRKGNGVTWGGSFWIAQKDSPESKPDAPDSDWRLAVKRGQNGKDGVMKAEPEKKPVRVG